MSRGFHPANAIDGDPGRSRDLSGDVAMEDWDVLFDAVVERLRATIEDMEPGMASRRRSTISQARDSILECAQALDQLHLAATHEFARCPSTDDNRLQSTRRPAGHLAAGNSPMIEGDTARADWHGWRAWYDKLRRRVNSPPSAQ